MISGSLEFFKVRLLDEGVMRDYTQPGVNGELLVRTFAETEFQKFGLELL